MIYKIFRPLIFQLNPESAHNLAINFLKYFPRFATILTCEKNYPNLQNKLFDLDFTSPIGLSAGFDKNCEMALTLQKFGFGFIEVGTVTPKAQIGNEKPRIFRLTKDQALINRLGFNNLGSEIFLQNLLKTKPHFNKILGVNIGKNKDTHDSAIDYLELMNKFYQHADYLTINISSPNTKNLRDLQNEKQLKEFLLAIDNQKKQLQITTNKNTPILLKIAPDLDIKQQQVIAEIVTNSHISGIVVSNTTIKRNFNIQSQYANELGGLSGKPLFDPSNEVLKNFYKFSNGKIPLIGVGGIFNAQDAYRKIRFGASLIQIYSAFIFEGFSLVEKIKKDLSKLLIKDGFKNIQQAIGIDNL
jgi:dihydroorotate dehydrogenase